MTTPAPVTPKDIIEDSISLATTETISCSSQAASSSTSVERENTFQKTSIGNFDLIDFLKNDLLGDAILYKSTKFKLDNTDRDRLCEILIKHLIHHYGKLNAEDFLVLSKKIVNAFPRELCSTYYVAAIPKTLSTKHEHEKARGKLIDKQRNLLYLIKRLKQSESIKENLKETIEEVAEEISQGAKDSQIWLRKNTEPAGEVITHWKQAYPIRKLSQSAGTISDFFESWPILKTNIATELIDYDFAQIHNTRSNFDIEIEFSTFFNNVLKQRKTLLSPADNTILSLLESEITTGMLNLVIRYIF